MTTSREDLEREEDQRLAPWAMRSSLARRTHPLEREGRVFDYRTEFQRDRDRILHSRAFKRLRLKSTGGAIPPVERYRDRLTHTLEVTQISRTVARSLGLNEDLVEAIALGHELGAPPFARAGEIALSALAGAAGGGFQCNHQSLRVVDLIEKRYRHAGLNLTDATREGILKHAPWSAGAHREAGLHAGWAPFFEAQVVAVVEEISSVVQDLDDGLRAGDLDPASVERLPIMKELSRRIEAPVSQRTGGARPGRGRGALFMRANLMNRGLTHLFVTGIIQHSLRSMKIWTRANAVETHESFLAARVHLKPGTIGLSPPVYRLYDGLRSFVDRRLHQGAWLSAVAARARHILSGIFQALVRDPRLADDYVLLRFREECGGAYLRDIAPGSIEKEITRRYRANKKFARLVVDHIAGMTDMFAIAEYERLLGPQLIRGNL